MNKNEILKKAKKIIKQKLDEQICVSACVCPKCGGHLKIKTGHDNSCSPLHTYLCQNCDSDYRGR